jgi:hypothetical protein
MKKLSYLESTAVYTAGTYIIVSRTCNIITNHIPSIQGQQDCKAVSGIATSVILIVRTYFEDVLEGRKKSSGDARIRDEL